MTATATITQVNHQNCRDYKSVRESTPTYSVFRGDEKVTIQARERLDPPLSLG